MFYKYDIATSEYLRETKDSFYTLDGKLIKGYTRKEPPIFDGATQLCKFVNGSWVVSDKPVDFRGQWEDIKGDIQSITEVGITPKSGYAKMKNNKYYFADNTIAKKITLKHHKKEKIQSFSNEFHNKLSKGFICSNGIKMKATMLDIVDLQLWYDLAISTNQTSMKIRNFDKTVHSLSVGEVKKMLKELKINFRTLR
ncbi:MAG TPA: hypothetical protein ENH23_08000, partial [candidate division Zixibacteria bacterium]|nr:hypothetical protein [candidate division Zixibacteria bacterium]